MIELSKKEAFEHAAAVLEVRRREYRAAKMYLDQAEKLYETAMKMVTEGGT